MRTTDYSDVLRGSAALAGIPLSELSPAEIIQFRTAHDRRLQVAWESHRWPEICTYERRSFRAPWSATTTYAATDEVLDIPTLNYLQALQPSTNQPPTINGVVNGVYWAVSKLQYQADDYISTGTYAIGSQVRNPVDGLLYQLFQTQMTVSGAGSDEANGLYTIVGQVSGRTCWSNGLHNLYWDGSGNWVIGDVAGSAHSWYTAPGDVPTPDLATGWVSVDQGVDPPPMVVATVPAPPEPTCWGLLTPFNRYVGWDQSWETNAIGEFLSAWDFDPRITTKLAKLPYLISADGAQFTTLKHVPAYVWLLIRLIRPELTGDTYDITTSYAVRNQMYYTDPSGHGNFFNCLAPSTPNQNPTSNPANWSEVELPYTFRQYLIQGGYADWLRGDGQTDKATAEETIAEQMLEFEADKLQRQQQQVNRLTFKSL